MLSLLTSQYKMAACGSGAANLFDYFPSDKRTDSDIVTASDKEHSLEPFLEPLKKNPRRQFHMACRLCQNYGLLHYGSGHNYGCRERA